MANTPAEAARDAEVVYTMLADDAAEEAVVFGRDGILNVMPKGSVHVASSTIGVATAKGLHAAHEEHGQQYLSAPVFGRPDAAAAAQLFIMVAGAPELVKKCEPLFSAVGQRTFVMGADPVMANVSKLSGNFMIASMIECLGETVALTKKYGVDPEKFIELLTNSLFAAPVYRNYGNIIIRQQFEPAGFKLELGLKDMRLALQAGENVAAPLPVCSLIRDHILEAIAKGKADLDWAVLSQVAVENAGLQP